MEVSIEKYRSLEEIRAEIKTGRLSCVGLVEAYLKQIETTQALNIYIETYAKEALTRASELDEKHRTAPETVGKLFGMVISVKDVLSLKGRTVTAASKILEGFVSLFTATAIERLEQQDAIVIGRVNCDQFAMGSSNQNSVYGTVKNPLNPSVVAGGSSGGSAAAVAAMTCLASIGSDTGGSVRQPAAFTGTIGLKPTYGRISRHGLLPLASSFDQVGIIAKSVKDAARLLEVMAGSDPCDATCSIHPTEPYAEMAFATERKVKIAYFEAAILHPSLDKSIQKATLTLFEQLRSEGHLVESVPFEWLDYLIPTYYVLTTAEASSNLARFDGVRYGYRDTDSTDLATMYEQTRTQGFSEEVKRRILLGTFVLSAGYYDAYYGQAQRIRRLLHDRILDLFQHYDFIIMPTTPTTAFKIGEKVTDPVEMYLADLYTVLANLVGIPALSLPLGTHPDNGLPFGVQLHADKFEESKLLAFASHLTDFYLRT